VPVRIDHLEKIAIFNGSTLLRAPGVHSYYGICVWRQGYSCISMNTQLPNTGSLEKDLIMTPLARTAAIVTLLALGTETSNATEPPDTPQPSLDATVQMSGKLVAAGIGYGWGHGKLSYHGEDYTLSTQKAWSST
jgi:hypothetical protein